MFTQIDLFSGIGGFALAAQWAGFRTVAFCEIDPYCQEILKQNFGAVAVSDAERRDGRENDKRKEAAERNRSAPRLYGDIRTFPALWHRGATLLTGGFPCQPFSQAGKRRGKEDDRYLWPEMLRVISEARPAWVLGENVAGIVTMELDQVLSDLEGEGYSCQPLIIPACAVDAKHRRDRVWIVGYAASPRCNDAREYRSGSSPLSARSKQSSQDVANAPRNEQGRQKQRIIGERIGQCCESLTTADCNGERCQDAKGCARPTGKEGGQQFGESICIARLWSGEGARNEIGRNAQSARWLPEPDVDRVVHGVPFRVDRLKGLGNAIVPQVAYEIIAGIANLYNAPSERPAGPLK